MLRFVYVVVYKDDFEWDEKDENFKRGGVICVCGRKVEEVLIRIVIIEVRNFV